VDDGFEIGLHGSYQSAVDAKVLGEEKEILESVLDRKINKVRQHWLRYDEHSTPSAHSQLFEYDSTLGWNDRIGFRSGCASHYRPYNHKTQRGFDFFETPQVVMDGNIFDYDGSRREKIVKKIFSLFEELPKCSNAHISISWHQRTCSTDYRWHNVYESLVSQ